MASIKIVDSIHTYNKNNGLASDFQRRETHLPMNRNFT